MNLENIQTNKENEGALQIYLRSLDDLQIEAEEKNLQPIELKAKLNVINDLYGFPFKFSIKDTESHYLTRATPTLDTVRAYTLKEIIQYRNTDLSGSIVPRIITTGVNFLFGAAKKGKSRFIYFLLRSLIITKEFLGFPTRRVGTILFYQLEESTTTVKKRLINSQLDDTENEDVLQAFESDQIVIIRDLDISGGINQIKKDVKAFGKKNRVDLIIIDSLRQAMSNSTISEVSADWAIPTAQLQSFGNRHNIAVIILHHMNAQGNPAGTSALRGYANQLMELHSNKDPEYSHKALILKTLPRDGTATSFIIQGKRRGKNESLELLKEEGVSNEVLSLEVRVLHLLKQDEYREGTVNLGTTIEEIADYLDLESTENLVLVLERLQESSFIDSIRSKGKDYYYIPNYILDLYSSLGVLGRVEVLEIKHQDISVLLQTATTKEEVNDAFKDLSEIDKDTVWSLLSDEHKNRIRSILLQTAFNKKQVLKCFKNTSDEDKEVIFSLLPEEHRIRVQEILVS